MKPIIENAPGLVWRELAAGVWRCHWQARTDLVAKGFRPKTMRLWSGRNGDLTPAAIALIQDRANSFQSAMLVFGRGGIPKVREYDETVGALIHAYRNDPDSKFTQPNGLRFKTREYYDYLMRRLDKDCGHEPVTNLKARFMLRQYETWLKPDEEGKPPKTAFAHAMVGMVRTLAGFGMTFLECDHCTKLSTVLSGMRFKMPKAREERLTSDQVIAVRKAAHELQWPSIALAQAIQFEAMLRQKDVIGEFVPIKEPGISEVTYEGEKWLRGLRFEEIDQNLILTHITSKRQKEIVIDLKLAGMVMEELSLICEGPVRRELLPQKGPVILCEKTGLPWTSYEFRRHWRKVANKAGLPKTVRNMDSRAGAISEATDAGADLEHVRHAATHSDIGMTQRYSRGGEEKTAGVMRRRAEHRKNKAGTE
jgi:site-specific recombinase XerC